MIADCLICGAVVAFLAFLAFLAGHRFGRNAGIKDGFTRGEQCAFQQGRQAERRFKP